MTDFNFDALTVPADKVADFDAIPFDIGAARKSLLDKVDAFETGINSGKSLKGSKWFRKTANGMAYDITVKLNLTRVLPIGGLETRRVETANIPAFIKMLREAITAGAFDKDIESNGIALGSGKIVADKPARRGKEADRAPEADAGASETNKGAGEPPETEVEGLRIVSDATAPKSRKKLSAAM